MSDEWVIVPRDATDAMVDAALDAKIGGKVLSSAEIYRAMLDDAPAAPQQAEPVAWMAFGGSIVHAVTRNAMDPIEAERFDVPLYLHPPAAEVQQAEPVGDFQRSAPGKIWMNLGNDGMDEIEYPTWDALVRADENITWSEDRIDATDIPYVRADLAHPPAAEVQRLRDALTAICAVADDREEGNYDTVPIHFIRSIARDATKGGK